MGQRTPLYATHAQAGAKLVDFGGWDMPLHYGSQKDEHHVVRRHAGMFDVSHMTVVDLAGSGTADFLSQLLANDIAKLRVVGKALYSCMLNDNGGVVDDLIAYWLGDDRYRLVVNAATRDKDLDWIDRQRAAFETEARVRDDLAMIAVQGPKARDIVHGLIANDVDKLKVFSAAAAGDRFVARTGYTGEDGFEILLPAGEAAAFWEQLADAGVAPAGLGARDTLRLEAAMNLYGNDMDESVSPLEAGLRWTVDFKNAERRFIGRDALEQQDAHGGLRQFVGLLLEGKGVLRSHQRVVVEGVGEGEITSGGYSPTIERSIALARVPAGSYATASVDIRGKLQPVRLVPTPFVRNGQIKISL